MQKYRDFLQNHYQENEKIGIMRISSGKVYNEIRKAETLMQAAGAETDSYMTMNPLLFRDKCIKRDKAHVGRLKWLYVDLDYYNSCYREFSKQQIIGLLDQEYFNQKMPVPTYVVDSGRGLYLLWRVDEHTNAYSRWAKMQLYLTEQLQEFGADRKVATDSARVLRRIGSINSKSGTKVQILRSNDVKYSLTNLMREYIVGDKPSEKMLQYAQHISKVLDIPMPGETRSEVKAFIRANKEPANLFYQVQKVEQRKKVQKRKIAYIGTEYSLLCSRIKDLETLLLKYRDMESSCREHILFLYRYWQICITESLEEGLNRTVMLNNKLLHPLELEEVVKATASAEKYYLAGKILKCTNAYVIDALHITQEEMKNLSVFVNSSERTRRKQERNKRAYLETLKKLGKLTKEVQIKQRRANVHKMLLQGKTPQEICNKLNISRATFYADKQQIECYLAAKEEKCQQRMKHFANYCQEKKEQCLKFSAFVLSMSFRTSVFRECENESDESAYPSALNRVCVGDSPWRKYSLFRYRAWKDWGTLQFRDICTPFYKKIRTINVNNIDIWHNVPYTI